MPRDHLLAIDIGNTNIVFGVCNHEEMTAHWSIATDRERTADEYAVLLMSLIERNRMSFEDIEGVAIAASVPPLLATFQNVCRGYLGVVPLVVGPGVKTGVRIRTDNPREVGPDRIANALAARELYGAPAIVIDFSTATTFDAISADGDYVGDAIAPGLRIAAEALFQQTAQLPRIELTAPPQAIGTNTVHSMQSGLVYGYVGLVEGMVRRFQDELQNGARVIATGEHAEVIAPHTEAIEIVDTDLTLAGLRLIYRLNRQAGVGNTID
ncbi:MAG: type III pantothenate kinase [Anaerolineae bacterium]